MTEKVIKAFFNVYNRLGYGFLEKVYTNALMIEFKKEKIQAVTQFSITVLYDMKPVGEYYADILIESKIILEIKAVKALQEEHAAQLLNYLKATNKEVGLLLNFGQKPEIRRKACDHNPKKSAV